jgi:hypothetical protein
MTSFLIDLGGILKDLENKRDFREEYKSQKPSCKRNEEQSHKQIKIKEVNTINMKKIDTFIDE